MDNELLKQFYNSELLNNDNIQVMYGADLLNDIYEFIEKDVLIETKKLKFFYKIKGDIKFLNNIIVKGENISEDMLKLNKDNRCGTNQGLENCPINEDNNNIVNKLIRLIIYEPKQNRTTKNNDVKKIKDAVYIFFNSDDNFNLLKKELYLERIFLNIEIVFINLKPKIEELITTANAFINSDKHILKNDLVEKEKLELKQKHSKYKSIIKFYSELLTKIEEVCKNHICYDWKNCTNSKYMYNNCPGV